MNKPVALIPLRGGSKGIPSKNIRPLAGKPLCAWVLEAAYESGIFSRIVVSTDSDKIAQVVHDLGLPVDVLARPAELATDTASTESVMLHAASLVPFDTLVTIQATSPLVKPTDFIEAWKLFEAEGFDSLLSAVRLKRFFWDSNGTPLNYDPQKRPRRQDFSGIMMENGAFYFTKRHILETTGSRLGGKIGIYEISPDTALEIDAPDDWHEIERLILHKKRAGLVARRLAAIRLVVVDVDGTLTDAGMYYSAKGDMLKKFNTRDAKGLELVRQHGVEVAIMTSEDSPIVRARARKLGIDRCFTGVGDKHAMLGKLCAELGITPDAVAYIGDDVNDLECLNSVGLSACPADAVQQVCDTALYVSSFKGGHGAVRDVCERIIESRQ